MFGLLIGLAGGAALVWPATGLCARVLAVLDDSWVPWAAGGVFAVAAARRDVVVAPPLPRRLRLGGLAAGALAGGLAGWAHGLTPVLLAGAVLLLLGLALALADLAEGVLPDPLVHAGLAAGLGLSLFQDVGAPGPAQAVTGMILGWALPVATYWIWLLRHGEEGLGLGDVKLMAMLGAWLGPAPLFSALLAGAGLQLAIGLARRLAHGERETPFGPALLAGGWLAWCGLLPVPPH